jgi:cytoskeletal protein CcmA (bactofilin family)
LPLEVEVPVLDQEKAIAPGTMTMAETETIIGTTITVSGELRSDENVMIQGKIAGRIETTADLLVEESGAIEAKVVTHSIDVRGRVVGNGAVRRRWRAARSQSGPVQLKRT